MSRNHSRSFGVESGDAQHVHSIDLGDDLIETLKGSFIVFEGPDGTGKSTALANFADVLKAHGLEVECLKEPGTTPLGEDLRSVLLNADYRICAMSEFLMFLAARAQLVETYVRPATGEGRVVLCDRYHTSSVIYQSHLRDISENSVYDLSEIFLATSMYPDLELVFMAPDEVRRERLRDKKPDRIESQTFRDVGEAYDNYVREHGDYDNLGCVIDAASNAEDVLHEVCDKVRYFFMDRDDAESAAITGDMRNDDDVDPTH